MKALVLAAVVLACAQGCGHDRAMERVEETPIEVTRSAPPPGVILRSQLIAVLQAGPGMLLQQLQLVPQRDGKRFVGFRIRTWFPANPELQTDQIRVGDVVVTVNGQRIERPEDLMALWAQLPAASEVSVRVLRGDQEHDVAFPIFED